MRFLFSIISVTLFSISAFAQDSGGISFGFSYDMSTVTPKALNDYRSQQLWNTTTPSAGTFDQLMGYTFGFSYSMDAISLGLEYSQGSQELDDTIVGASTIADSFIKDTLYFTYDYHAYANEYFSVDVGAAVGYALNYEFHQKAFNPGSFDEDVAWVANPFGFKARLGINVPVFSLINLRLGATYESMASYLEAKDSVSLPGYTVTAGQKLSSSGRPVYVDMSGISYGLSLGFIF